MGRAILANVTVNGTSVVVTGGAPNASVQVWCTNTAANDGSSSGAVTMAVVNAASVAQAFSAPSIAALTPRVEYVLTATKEMYTHHREAGEGGGGGGPHPHPHPHQQLPDELWNDAIYLNGARMTVSGQGVLPAYPIQGKTIHAGGEESFVFPPWSYGFIVFPNADVAACRAR